MKVAYAITWRYHDGSGCGVICAHVSESRANDMLAIVAKAGDSSGKQFAIEALPFDDETAHGLGKGG